MSTETEAAPATSLAEADKPEFSSSSARKAHVAALVNEKSGYDAKAAGLKARGDDAQAGYYEGRAAQVQEQLDRLGGSASKPSARATRR